MVLRNDEHTREVGKLRAQIQSMEEKICRLAQSCYQLDQATKQNDTLVATLQETKAHKPVRAQVEKLTAPPSFYAIFFSLSVDGTGNVYVS